MTKPFLGVVHLPPLPAAAGWRGSFAAVLERAMRDAEALAEGGVDGVIVENFGDAPFHKGTRDDPATPDVAAGLAVVADRIRREFHLEVGINCLRNDGPSALGAAAVCGARWVRINVLANSYVTDQGVIEAEAARVRDYKNQMQSQVEVLADFLVKHAVPLAPLDPVVGARDLAERSGAAGLVLSGSRTGESVDQELLLEVKAAVGAFPVWIGSGLDLDNAGELWPRCDGAIVGTALKVGGAVLEPVDPARVRELRAALAG
jgi:membrane complex biogenesis BtpA family protein